MNLTGEPVEFYDSITLGWIHVPQPFFQVDFIGSVGVTLEAVSNSRRNFSQIYIYKCNFIFSHVNILSFKARPSSFISTLVLSSL